MSAHCCWKGGYFWHVCIRLPNFLSVLSSAWGSRWQDERCGDAKKEKEPVTPRYCKSRQGRLPVRLNRCRHVPCSPPSKHPQYGRYAEPDGRFSASFNDPVDATALRVLERIRQVMERLVRYVICLSVSTCVDDTLP